MVVIPSCNFTLLPVLIHANPCFATASVEAAKVRSTPLISEDDKSGHRAMSKGTSKGRTDDMERRKFVYGYAPGNIILRGDRVGADGMPLPCIGTPERCLGDFLVSPDNPLFDQVQDAVDAANGKSFERDGSLYAFTVFSPIPHATVTMQFDEGSIMLQGVFDFSNGEVSEVAVVGGTGVYSKARGYATFEQIGESGTFVTAYEFFISTN